MHAARSRLRGLPTQCRRLGEPGPNDRHQGRQAVQTNRAWLDSIPRFMSYAVVLPQRPRCPSVLTPELGLATTNTIVLAWTLLSRSGTPLHAAVSCLAMREHERRLP